MPKGTVKRSQSPCGSKASGGSLFRASCKHKLPMLEIIVMSDIPLLNIVCHNSAAKGCVGIITAAMFADIEIAGDERPRKLGLAVPIELLRPLCAGKVSRGINSMIPE